MLDRRPVRVLVVIGTRPEAIKMAPVVLALRRLAAFHVTLCLSGQHGSLAREALAAFGLRPDERLDVVRCRADLFELTATVVHRLGVLIDRLRPDRLLVHGDTCTALAAAMAGHLAGVPVAHVEAGLRTGDPASPWPEEGNRRAIAVWADLHFAPTAQARRHLLAESVAADRIEVTGNTGIDAVRLAQRRLATDARLRRAVIASLPRRRGRRLVLATAHRRENFGAAHEALADGLTRLASLPDVAVCFVRHPNPSAASTFAGLERGRAGLTVLPPQPYFAFVHLLIRSDVVVTDSGGVQEEAAALERPVVVVRGRTERPEAVAFGSASLVPPAGPEICSAACYMLYGDGRAKAGGGAGLFGDGAAAGRIVRRLAREHGVPAAGDRDLALLAPAIPTD